MTTETLDLAHPPAASAGVFPDRSVHQPRAKALSHHDCCRGGLPLLVGQYGGLLPGDPNSRTSGLNPFASSIPWLPTGDTWFNIGVHDRSL